MKKKILVSILVLICIAQSFAIVILSNRVDGYKKRQDKINNTYYLLIKEILLYQERQNDINEMLLTLNKYNGSY